MTLVRLAKALGLVALTLLCLGLTGFLAVIGYLAASIGAERMAVGLFAASLCPVALVAIVGSLLSQRDEVPLL